MRRPLQPFPARPARGGITWVTALLILAVTAGVYLAWMWLPVYVVHYEVKQVVREYMNRAVKDPNDDQLVQDMLHKMRVLDQLQVPDDDGRMVAVPTVQVAPSDVTWERDTTREPPTLHVAFAYTRWVRYPVVERWTQTALSIDLEDDLSRPDWGPER